MSLNLKIFALAICCSIISHYSLVYGQQPSSNAVDYDAEFSKICTLLSSDPYNAELYSKLKVLPGKLPDINEQCRCAAIYCLAVSVAGNSTEASKAMRFIEKKNPNSEYLQRLSGNNLSENCPNCNGKGTITSQCKTCGGSGQCSTCNGNGSRPGIGNTSIKCPACMGAGKCKQCNGTGDTTQKCQKCGGKGRILSIQSIKSEYLALLKERSGKQSNIAVATGRDVKDEQKKEESVTKKPFVETAVYKSKDGGLDYGQNPYEGREGAKGSHIAKQKESGQHQIELSDDSKSTSALANKSENDCDQQYGKPLKRTVLDDGYVEAIYEKKNTTINIIFNKDGCIDCISYLSNEPFTEEQRKVLIENYSINKEEWSHSPMASLYLFPKPIKDGSRTDFAINQLVSNMIRMPSTPYGVWVRSDNGDFMGMWGRGDGAEAFYYKKAGYILKIQSKNYAEWVQKEKEKSGNKEKQVERSRVDGL